MGANFLTTDSVIQCPHGGMVTLITSNAQVMADGAPILLETDQHVVAGCPFVTPAGVPSPCTLVQWSAGTVQGSVNGVPMLTSSSQGICVNPTVPMAQAIISSYQTEASGT